MTIRVIREHDAEPVPGLPQALPVDEQVLWRGRPLSRWFARDVLKSRWIGFYFAALAIATVASAVVTGSDFSGAMMAAGVLLLLGAVVIGLLELIAWAIGKTTVYTVTNKRLVMRVGIALPMTVNIPFSKIVSVDRRHIAGDCGDLSITLAGPERVSWLMLWPHVRMWKLRWPTPVLRCLPRLDRASDIIASALQEFVRRNEQETEIEVTGSPRPQAPVSVPVAADALGRVST